MQSCLSPITTYLVSFGFSRTEEQTDTAKLNRMLSGRGSENVRGADRKWASACGQPRSKLRKQNPPAGRRESGSGQGLPS